MTALRDALVPSFILQPIVENAIRHGTGRAAAGRPRGCACPPHGRPAQDSRSKTTESDCRKAGAWRITPVSGYPILCAASRNSTDLSIASPYANRTEGGVRVEITLPFHRQGQGAASLKSPIGACTMNWQIRVVIVDDEKPARARLITMLERQPAIQVLAACSGGEEALDAVSTAARSGAPVNLIFLDVQMPEMDAFATLEALYALPLTPMPVVVFATAYDEYALRAFDAHAVDYLLKPYSDERFEVALTRAIRLVRGGASDTLVAQMQALLHDLVGVSRSDKSAESSRHDYTDRLALKDRGRVRLIDVSEIRWIAAAGVYVTIHTTRQSYLHREVLGGLEAQLDPRHFLRIHRSHIVNFHFVHEFVQDAHGDYVVILNDRTPLKIGRMYRSRLEGRLNQRL